MEAALALYAVLGSEQTASRGLSLPPFLIGAPLTQPLTNRASEAVCWGLLASVQVHAGQVHDSMRSGRKALALAQESKNVWAHITSTHCLTQGLLEAGAYEEALGLVQLTLALGRTLPPTLIYQLFLLTLGRTYQALQQWEEARSTLEEAETLDHGRLRVSTLSQLCMHYAVVGEWGQAHTYAVQAIALRKSFDRALIVLDFFRQYETEALLRGGDERQARAEVHRLGERLGSNRRFRIPYLRSSAVLAAWDGDREQAIGHLREAAGLAAEIGLSAEQWQIQAALGRGCGGGGGPEQAHTAFGEAARIIQGLAEGITDETRRARFLAGLQIQPVVQQAYRAANETPQDHAEQSELRDVWSREQGSSSYDISIDEPSSIGRLSSHGV